MQNHKFLIIITAAVGILLSASSASGQIIYGQPPWAGTRLIYSHWSLDSSGSTVEINQFMLPVSGFVPVKDNLEVRFYMANASNDVDDSVGSYSMSGLSDLRLQINQSLAEDRILTSVGINLPTGKKKLNLIEERLVMNYLSQNYLSFPIRRLGEGIGLNFLIGAAAASGETRYGASVMFQLNGAYEAYEGDGDYNPGEQLSISAGAETKLSDILLNANMIFSTYSVDKLDGNKIFKQSRQLDIVLGGSYSTKRYAISAGMRYLIRDRNTRYVPDSTEAISDQLKIFGNEFSFDTRFSWMPSEMWYIMPMMDLRVIAANEIDNGGSNIFGLGIETGRKLGKAIEAGVGLKYMTGSAGDGKFDLSGFQFSTSLTATL
jgi:hypothetical protein